jgi:hypothetical protein
MQDVEGLDVAVPDEAISKVCGVIQGARVGRSARTKRFPTETIPAEEFLVQGVPALPSPIQVQAV